MTTINCSSNCIHQQEGKCTLDSVTNNPTSFSSDCIFFEEKMQKLYKHKKV
jgi:hypothetical protein